MSKNLFLVVMLVLAVGMTLVEVVAALRNVYFATNTQLLWGLFSILLSAAWATADAKGRKFEAPFEFGFLVYVFWPIVLPWYLVATRGLDGLLMFFGFVLLLFGPWLTGLIVFVYSS